MDLSFRGLTYQIHGCVLRRGDYSSCEQGERAKKWGKFVLSVEVGRAQQLISK